MNRFTPRAARIAVLIASCGTLAALAQSFDGTTTSPAVSPVAAGTNSAAAAGTALNDAQRAEIAARVAKAQAVIARLEASPASKSLGSNWKYDAMNLLLSMRSDQIDAVSQDSAWTSLGGMRAAAKTARAAAGSASTKALGSPSTDLVFNPITPCRNADTRNAGGPIAGGTARTFNADSSASQGGAAGCYVTLPSDASAWAMNITVVNMNNLGFVAVRSVGSTNTTATVNYTGPGQQVNNFVIVQNNFMSGAEWEVYAATTVDVIIDLFGYFRPPQATALQCTIASSAVTAVAVNSWTAIDATCPTGYSAVGGGFNTPEGTLGYPGVWTTNLPISSTTWRTWVDNQTNGPRSIQTFAQCCRVPGF
jgi:hypothetical protein